MMKKNLYLIALLAIACIFPATAQEKATGFSELKLYFDPGHYGTANKGYGDYSEAEKVLQIAHALKEYLVTYTDIKAENIKLSRELDSDIERSFDARADECAAMGAHFFYSIHSDAPSAISGATLYMYGGRRTAAGQPILEKLPEGGKQFGDILNADLTPMLRLNKGTGTYVNDASRGNMPDLQFYGSSSTTPYLAVNRTTNTRTASLLSEAGFHTNPQQNMQFVNVEFKKMQAYATYQTFVRYLSEKHLGGRIEPVQVGIATGFVFDEETNAPVNGAVITVTEAGKDPKIYTTDTYESLPKKYAFTPEEFGNGFYWLEGFTPGATVDIKVEANGFDTQETTLTIPATVGATTKDGLAIKDFKMLNLMPAKVTKVEKKNDLSGKTILRHPLDIVFSRKMDKASVEAATDFSPAATVSYSWPNDFTLRVDISNVEFETTYTITIDGSVAKNSVTEDFLDGDGNGTPGGNYEYNFTTGDLDTDPPVIVSYDPQGDQEISARPIVRIEFDEYLNELSFGHTPITVTNSKGEVIEGIYSYHTTSNFKSVLHYLFFEDLMPQEKYTVTLVAGIEDVYGNAIDDEFTFTFTARPREKTLVTTLFDFNNTLGANWYALTPGASGSTVGNTTESQAIADSQVKPTMESAGSARLDYQWVENADLARIRWHNNGTTPKFSKDNEIQYYLFGDGSNSQIAVVLRNGSGGPFFGQVPFSIDWVGWKLITWDISNDPLDNWLALGAGAGALPTGDNLNLSAFRIEPAPVAERLYEVSSIYLAQLRVVHLGAFLGDVGVEKISTEGGISVSSLPGFIDIAADAVINDVKIYSITGALLKSIQPEQASYQIPASDLTPGIYIVKVATATSQRNVKALVK